MSYTKHLRDDQFSRIASSLPGFSGTVGHPVDDNRRFIEGVDLGRPQRWSLTLSSAGIWQVVKYAQTLG
jgi:hypothetical protein